ncbi:MAG: LEA type 2 family protein [Woeseiaceae bacterium]|nr:LEA type 2 family protein [Woeseiaceae bacterium]
MLPSNGALPAFDIGLRVTNPNRNALRLQGISYTVSLEGNQVIEGVGRDFPVIEAYGQEDIRITASANLFAGIRLFSDLLRSPRDSVDYTVEARLDLGGLRPSLRVRDEGSLSLSGVR